MNRGFEVVNENHRKFKHSNIILPKRSTKYSAGYDFYSNEEIIIAPNQQYTFWTDVKAYMLPDEFLGIHVRSSIAIKSHLVLKNQEGIIDSDYYSNIDNDGNIGICLKNVGVGNIIVKVNDRIAQGIFQKYLTIDDEEVIEQLRSGGVGSTDKI